MHDLGFRPFDADNHYYEAEDAFIRHIDPAMQKRCMQWAEVNGKKRLLVAGKINKFIPNPTFDPIAKPGSLEDYFRGKNEGGLDMKTMFGDLEPIAEHPGYREPRRPAASCSTSRAWTARCCSPRSASACRRRSSATCPRCTPRSAPSTTGSTRTGASTAATVASTPRR